MPQISVIVPVYKVELSLRRCIDSILNQTYSDFELILVDDGSPDNCPAICDEYAQKDPRIVVIHQKNCGLGVARNVGLKIAQGTFVLFCDSDDAYAKNAFVNLMEQVQEVPDADLYCFDYLAVTPEGISDKRHYTQVTRMENTTPHSRLCFCSSEVSHRTMGYAVWDKLYRNSIIQQFVIRDMKRDSFGLKDDWCEDLYFNLQYFLHAQTIQTLGKPYYLLTTHGEGNGYGVQNRTIHVAVLMQHLYQELCRQQVEPEILENFWRIPVWHLKRFFYIDVAAQGAAKVRQQLVEHPGGVFMLEQIRSALSNWNSFKGAWKDVDEEDYRIMLQYFWDGNHFWYRLQNFFLWKIKSKWS